MNPITYRILCSYAGKELRLLLKKYRLRTTGELFDRAYAYIRENY